MRKTIGVLKEVYSPWERRSPLAAHHVRKLVDTGHKVVFQRSPNRVFDERVLELSGATFVDEVGELDSCDVILGVKQPKLGSLLPKKTYCFFSHTIKAQAENMGLLDECLAKKIRLVDYECIVDENKSRAVKFGEFAGKAGMIDTLRGLGESMLLNDRVSSPFLKLGSTYMYDDYESAISAVKRCGEAYEGQIIVAFAGSGSVSTGAKKVFNELNPYVTTLNHLNPAAMSSEKFVGIDLSLGDLFRNSKGGEFNRDEYNSNPSDYESNISNIDFLTEKCNIIMNSNYWDHRFPELITEENVKHFKNLKIIGDLSCDVNGSIQLLHKSTTIENPFLVHDSGLYILGVDILPSELPKEASTYFGDQLSKYIPSLLKTETSHDIVDAIICQDGELQDKYKYIAKLRNVKSPAKEKPASTRFSSKYILTGHIFDERIINDLLDFVEHHAGSVEILDCIVKAFEETQCVLRVHFEDEKHFKQLEEALPSLSAAHKSSALKLNANKLSKKPDTAVRSGREKKYINIFGSGLMTAPAVKYLMKNPDFKLRMFSNNVEELKRYSGLVETIEFDVSNKHELNSVVGESATALNISLLPANYHLPIMQACAKEHKPLVTASYVPEDVKLDSPLDTMFLFEMGLDPGIDHMSAMQMFEGKRNITSFSSVCGGLYKKSGKVDDNHLNYKFSWSPKGVLTAAKNSATYLKDGNIVKIKENEILDDAVSYSFRQLDQPFEVIPNRDSLKYIELYGLKDQPLKSFFRGTLRYPKFCKNLSHLNSFGLLRDDIRFSEIAEFGGNKFGRELARFKASNEDMTAIDGFCEFLMNKNEFNLQGEPDAIYMEHVLRYVDEEDRESEEVAQLVMFGDAESSAMAKTVGVTVAIAAEEVFENLVANTAVSGTPYASTGIMRPLHPAIYNPIMEKLKKEGIIFSHFSKKF